MSDQKSLVNEHDHTSINIPNHEEPTCCQKFGRGVKGFIRALKPDPCPWTLGGYIRLLVVLIILAALVLVIIFRKEVGDFIGTHKDPKTGKDVLGPLPAFIKEIGIWGPIAYGGFYIIATVFFIPGTILTVAAGIIFKELWVAFLTISLGSTLGAAAAFLLGKSVMRNWVEQKVKHYPLFQAIDRAIGQKGFVMVLLLRLSPALPFNLLNYACGITSVTFIPYFFASWFGMAPGTLLYVYIPWAAKNAAESAGKTKQTTDVIKDILVFGVGPVVTLAAVIVVTYFARKEIKKAMAQNEEDKKLLSESNQQE